MSTENNPPVKDVHLSQAVDIDITLSENLMLTFTAPGTFRIPGPYKGNFFPPLPDGVAFTAGQSWPPSPLGAKPLGNDSVGYTYGSLAHGHSHHHHHHSDGEGNVATGMKTIKSGSGISIDAVSAAPVLIEAAPPPPPPPPPPPAAPTGTFSGMKTIKSGS